MTGHRCPCCAEPMSRREFGEDADFCWTCGIYADDPASECDDPDHARTRKANQ